MDIKDFLNSLSNDELKLLKKVTLSDIKQEEISRNKKLSNFKINDCYKITYDTVIYLYKIIDIKDTNIIVDRISIWSNDKSYLRNLSINHSLLLNAEFFDSFIFDTILTLFDDEENEIQTVYDKYTIKIKELL